MKKKIGQTGFFGCVQPIAYGYVFAISCIEWSYIYAAQYVKINVDVLRMFICIYIPVRLFQIYFVCVALVLALYKFVLEIVYPFMF